ncbi:hypothetical protein D3C72_1593040 [compost metagenome]
MQFHHCHLVGVVDLQFRLVVVQHLPQVFAREAQQHGHRRRRHLAPVALGRRCGACSGRRQPSAGRVGHHRHQFGAEAIATMHTAQGAGEGHRCRRYQLDRFARVRGRAIVGRRQHEGPATQLESPVVVAHLLARIRLEQQHGRFLHGQVVVVAHLGLAVFEATLVGGAFGEEQIRIGLPCDLHPRIQARLESRVGLSGRGLAARHRR